MSYFVTTFFGLLAAVMLIGSLLWRSLRVQAALKHDLAGARRDIIRHLRDADHFRIACEHASDGILIQDMSARIVWANPAYQLIHGRKLEDIIGLNPLSFAIPPDEQPTPEAIRAFRYDPDDPRNKQLQVFRNRDADGHIFWNQISVSFRKTANGEEHAILVCRDITKQMEQETRLRDTRNQLQHEATHDYLTGLPNRPAFLRFIDTALKQSRDASVGLLHVDLDDFKSVNDTHGHSAGDAVLVHTAAALRENIRAGDLVARIGGDEFVIVCPRTRNLNELDKIAKALIADVARPFDWNGRRLACNASIGAALSRRAESSHDDLLLRSDFALYEAKKSGRNRVCVYDSSLHKQHTDEMRRAAELTEAIDTGSMKHYFQPTFCLDTGQITGLETLVRWDHPKEGLLAPAEFLPMVEQMGLMGALDLWSMTAALQQKRLLDRSGLRHIGIAFNASPSLLSHPEFINRLVWSVEAGEIERAQVTIEVLENTAFGDTSQTSSHAAVIRDLFHAGFKVQLDDFGIGFAGLAHLARLDVTSIKIDRTLVKDIMSDEAHHKIVRKIVELANDLGLDVIGEGVEDAQTADALHKMGCRTIQGYWIARPRPTEGLTDWLTDHAGPALPLRA